MDYSRKTCVLNRTYLARTSATSSTIEPVINNDPPKYAAACVTNGSFFDRMAQVMKMIPRTCKAIFQSRSLSSLAVTSASRWVYYPGQLARQIANTAMLQTSESIASCRKPAFSFLEALDCPHNAKKAPMVVESRTNTPKAIIFIFVSFLNYFTSR